ncbi:hypothetical protein JQ599_27515 [Bradyrhizobium diazoefficiens]|nr:hypothetical protein [Bradyrhizobium diazoefficiens]MBR0703684.1 hypothetical protein [Bradyrhizobium diazoefficiens]MBR0772440.1 hypothetical protein [Bradyrhizobium diazoefficiens]
MRPIDTAPRDGEFIWVEGAAGAIEAVRWSSDMDGWVWKDGTPVDIAPTHWYPAAEYVDPDDEPSGSSAAAALILIPAIFLGAALLAAFDPFSSGAGQDAVWSDGRTIFGLHRQAEVETGSQAALQQETTAASMLAVPPGFGRQQFDEEQALASGLAGARNEFDITVPRAQAAEAAAERLRQSLRQEQAGKDALTVELARSRRELETRDEDSRNAADVAEQQRKAMAHEIAELRQSLQEERDKNAELVAEAKAARAETANAEQQSRAVQDARAHAAALASELTEARREIEARNIQLRDANDAIAQQKQAASQEIAELRQALRQQRSGTEAQAGDRKASSSLAEDVSTAPATERLVPPTTQNGGTMVAEGPVAARQSEAETRLIPRARALLDQGDIGAARIVLELAAEKDVPQASFMLAETYDPAVLSALGTYGTRSEVARARELYAKAQKGGIRGAQERLDALPR